MSQQKAEAALKALETATPETMGYSLKRATVVKHVLYAWLRRSGLQEQIAKFQADLDAGVESDLNRPMDAAMRGVYLEQIWELAEQYQEHCWSEAPKWEAFRSF